MAPGWLWFVRAGWLGLPFTLLEHLLDATVAAPTPLDITIQVLFWVLWAAGFVVSLIPLPSTLTAMRIIVPIAPAASLFAAALTLPDPVGWVGLALGTLVSAAALSAPTGDWFIDGASYGDERRFALRPPAALLIGPLQLVWLVTVAPLIGGFLLVANKVWFVGTPLLLAGIATAWWGSLVLWRLARRWAVFVPAGLTVVDTMTLREPVLFAARNITRIGPAHVGSQALDLTAHAPGLVLEVDLGTPSELIPSAGSKGYSETVEVSGVLIVPSRPATLLANAQERGLAVQRD